MGALVSTALEAAAPCGAVRDYIYAGTRLLAVAAPLPPAVGLSAAAASVIEQPRAQVTVTVVLQTSDGCPTRGPITFTYSTVDGTAQAGLDYMPASGTVSFAAGTRSGTTYGFDVTVRNDVLPEPSRTFSIVLSDVSGASVGISTQEVTILDNDTPIVSFVSSASTVGEDGGWVTQPPGVQVVTNEHNDLVDPLAVAYATSDGTALVGVDYLPPAGALAYPAQTPSGTIADIDLQIVQDALIEDDESFSLSLVPTGGVSLGTLTEHAVTVVSDDVVSVTGTMVASGGFAVGGTVSYAVLLTNTGPGAQSDNPGDEFVDVLPPALTLVPPGVEGGSTASAGTLAASGSALTWNGALAAGETVVLTIRATINAETYGQQVSNQGTIRFDSNASGDNDAAASTDDPRVPGPADPTVFQVGSGPTSFNTLAPCRVIDTRNTDGPRGGPALAARSDRTFALAGQCGIPISARAIAFSMAVTGATARGNLSLRPAGTPPEPVSAVNYGAGQTRANNGMVALSPAGEVTVRCNQTAGTVHLILDVSGYFE